MGWRDLGVTRPRRGGGNYPRGIRGGFLFCLGRCRRLRCYTLESRAIKTTWLHGHTQQNTLQSNCKTLLGSNAHLVCNCNSFPWRFTVNCVKVILMIIWLITCQGHVIYYFVTHLPGGSWLTNWQGRHNECVVLLPTSRSRSHYFSESPIQKGQGHIHNVVYYWFQGQVIYCFIKGYIHDKYNCSQGHQLFYSEGGQGHAPYFPSPQGQCQSQKSYSCYS